MFNKGGINMGLFDNLRKIFSSSNNVQPVQVESEQEKSILSDKIVNLVSKIKRINSFDSSLWNLSNVSSYELKRKSLDELKRLHANLENRLSELDRQSQKGNPEQERIERAKWTGEKSPNVSSHDLDWSQR